ncbi:MAG: TonB-dependent receptor [Gemmatimonadaceae bacterium]|nr:TonB-dependent receptor [Gemmatimonadaceae bacterium]
MSLSHVFRTLCPALLLTLACVGGRRARAQGVTRHLHGVVQDSVAARPLANALILVDGATVTRRARTDDAGHFDIHDLPAAPVRLTVRMVGYAPLTRAVDLTRGDVRVTVTLAQTTVQLTAVSVTGDTLADPLANVASTTTLDAEALARQRGQTLGETIKYVPGVSLIQFGPSIAKPVIRGLNSQRILVMNSGLRQEDQQWGTEHAPNIDSFDADVVTVVRGAATVLYGPDAIGGVVRVDRAAVPTTGGLRGDLSLNAFTNNRQGAMAVGVEGANLRLPRIGATGYRVRMSSRVAGNGAAPDYHLSNTGFRELNGSVALGVTRHWGSTDLLVSRFATELGVLRQAHAGSFEDLQRAMTTAPRDSAFRYAIGRPNQQVSHTTARVRSLIELPHGNHLELVYGLQFNHRREYDNHGALRVRNVPAFNLKLFTNTLDARWRHAPVGRLTGTVGTSVIYQGNQTLGKGFLIPGYDLGQGAVYAQEELSLGRVQVSMGLRTDLISQTTIAFADQGIRSPAGTRRWNDMSGSFGTSVWLRDHLQASVRVARAWRPPTVNERYAQGVHHGSAQYELGSAQLDAERSLGFEASVKHTGSTLAIDAAVYDNRIDGFIFLRPREPVFTLRGTFPAFTYSATDARLRGAEIATSLTPLEWLQLTGTGALVRGTQRRDGTPLFDMPADRLTLQSRLLGTDARFGRWSAGVGAVLVRRQDGVPNGTIYTLPTAGYGLMSADVSMQQMTLFGRPMDLSLSVTNLLDQRYRDYLSRYRLFVNDAGRDIVTRLRIPL